jgi:hypothetical protein
MAAIDPFLARVGQIFQASGDHLVWNRLDDDQVLNLVSGRYERSGQSGPLIEAEKAYFTVRLTEMFLGRSRTLWRKFYPVVHAFCSYSGAQQHAVAGPGQLQTVTDAGLDRVVTLNFRLAGPTAFRGGDVSVVAGLYSVPGDDAAKALVETVSAITGLAVLQTSPVAQIAQITQVIKNGIDSIFQLSTTRIRLGVNDTMIGSQPLRCGYYVGIGAPVTDIDFSQLWLVDGHLVQGRDPIAGRPFTGSDYMVIQLERTERLPNWPALPGMSEQQQRFNTVLGDDLSSASDKSEQAVARVQRSAADQPVPHQGRRESDRERRTGRPPGTAGRPAIGQPVRDEILGQRRAGRRLRRRHRIRRGTRKRRHRGPRNRPLLRVSRAAGTGRARTPGADRRCAGLPRELARR